MDLFRPRAIPALVAALLAVPAAAVECASLEGTYRFDATQAASAGEPAESLMDLTTGKERSKLYRVDAPGSKGAFGGSQAIQRPKTTVLATKATLKRSATKTTLTFMDGGGKVLAELGIDELGRWSCKSGHLERHNERMSGLGDSIRTERVEEVLERSAAGDLVHRTAITTLDPKGIKPAIREAVFPAAR
ncbi:MAG TPA: hypothetical protein VGI57_00685 [Usitatibacter sp.]